MSFDFPGTVVGEEDPVMDAYTVLTGGARRPSADSETSQVSAYTAGTNSLPKSRNRTRHGNGVAFNTPPVEAKPSPPPSDGERLIVHTMPRRSYVADNIPRLVYTTKFGGKTDFPLIGDETTVGRRDDNNISLPCARISKYHGLIVKGEQGYYLRDKNSSNGIRVNDKLIAPNTPHLLRENDKIEIGSFILYFHDGIPRKIKVEPSSPLPSPSTPTTAVPGSVYGAVASGAAAYQQPPHALSPSRRPSAAGQNDDDYKYNKLVTILPSEQKYDQSMTIQAELPATGTDMVSNQFQRGDDVTDINTLREDYEKLRLAYELSKVFSTNITSALSKSCELMFDILPIDRAVVLLREEDTNMLCVHYVKIREGRGYDHKEICLSSTILRKVFHSRKCLVTSDAFEDPMLSKQASVKVGQIRSVICVPLISHNKVHGILHLDSRDRINAFSTKDVSLVLTISTQTALAIENSLLIKEIQNKAKLQENLSRFLPPHVVSKMTHAKGIEGIRKGGREVVGTILFADIRGFTQLSEKSTPSEVVSLLNDYFERLVNIVFKYSGIVDKYIGDALMAAFGTLADEGPDPEFRAVSAALEFKEAIRDMNIERAKTGKEPVSVGIGLNTGELLTGFIGSSQRLEYTCIGDTVNTSSRICSMASTNQVLISQSTWDALNGRFEVQEVGGRMFKGKEREVVVHEVMAKLDLPPPERLSPPPAQT
ncbi:uncharacterized protein EV422DRAFT_182831 [Fimicolochytrium jonesii]|uniref:uncharacterized protein n=1 Tax=Fimicolochytrium jonesii TaxID=1396493 RepID=UPI0022FE8469|nr:uncharacterized protein EV422DRAFT_182831 [Fimicolochytrium jonesii]KAI8818372.1 hypothetical protein EV422DRAFT_182831 [Fimicolochytrium jonesii]